MVFKFLLLFLCHVANAQYEAPPTNYCSKYVECVAVSVLEERLCLGNSVWRPYWLPQRNDPNKCHDRLKNDYNMLDRLEEELDSQMNACLSENSKPINKNSEEECAMIREIPKFSYGRSITYVPNHCFTGLKRRIERQCSPLVKCCTSIEKCKLLNSETTLQKMINTTRANLRKRAEDCQKGIRIDELAMNNLEFSKDAQSEQTWAPTGHVNVNFKSVDNTREDDENRVSGHVNVHFSTVAEQEARARKLLIRYGDKHGDDGSPPPPRLSYPNSESFETSFDKALKNTNAYKSRLEETTGQAIDSLLDAATISESATSTMVTPPMGTVTVSTNVDGLVVEDFGVDTVTTSPIIFIEKPTPEPNHAEGERRGCRESKTIRFTRVLELLGEKAESKDFQEVLKLVKKFEESLEGKTLSADQQNKAKLIEKSLEMLLQNFDDSNFEKIQKTTEHMIKETQTLPICKATVLEISASIDDTNTTSTMLVDDNGDKFLVEEGSATLIVGNPKNESEEIMENFISEEYKNEIQEFRKQHILWSTKNSSVSQRNETTCDMYMRCRSQMHMAVDSCAWRFASDKLLATMAESAESLLFKDDGVCTQNGEQFTMLYENVIKRNDNLRSCLDTKNQKFFDESICMAYTEDQRKEYAEAIKRLLDANYEYGKSRECFRDANLIQEKCTHLRDCCPNFDVCREETFDAEMERIIINLTAKINEMKQECVKQTAKEAVKTAVRQLLLSTKSGQKLAKIAQFGLDISRGARVVRMAKYRV